MGAQTGIVGDVTRLREPADEVASSQNRPQHGGGIVGISAQIAVAQVGCGEKCRSAGQIKNDIAVRFCVAARWPERQYAARGRHWLRKIVDRDLERAEMALGISHPSFCYRKNARSRRCDGRRWLNQHGDVEMVLEQIARFNGGLVAPTDENDAVAFQCEGWRSRRWLGCGRKQRCHFRPGSSRLTGPSGGLS